MSSSVRTNEDLTARDVGRSLINSAVLVSTSFFLLIVSCLAFFFFYHYNVPAIAVNKLAHLQHNPNSNPFAQIDLEFSTSKLALSQPYNVIVELVLPDTPSNHEIGNFMVQLEMLSDSESIISSARPAIMKYTSPLIQTMSTVLFSGPILFGFKKQSQRIVLPVLESHTFEAGWLSSPSQARIEIHAPDIKIYECKIMFQSKLEGLNWMLYNFKVTSFLLYTTLFWISSMFFMLSSWALITFVLFPTQRQTRDDSTYQGGMLDSLPPSRSSSPVPKSESSEKSFPRMPQGRQPASVASSSIETSSFFQFDDDDKKSYQTDPSTVDYDGPRIKEESESDSEML